MSLVRLAATSAVMAGVAVMLSVLAPAPADLLSLLGDGQRTADLSGPDVLVLAAAGLLAWLVWAWGALGLLLTAASGLPGLVGALARPALRCLLPAAARRVAALALGAGLGVAAPVLVPPALGAATASAAPWSAVPDWPTGSGAPTPAAVPDAPVPAAVQDWPAPAGHVVLRGDCLWTVAATWLRDRDGAEPSDALVAAAVHAWWTTNADVIGPDPDLLLPGQVLRPPS